MPPIDLAAALPAAAPPVSTSSVGQPATAGFAEALAGAQNAANPGGPEREGGVSPEPRNPGSSPGTRGDARVRDWLARARLGPPLAASESSPAAIAATVRHVSAPGVAPVGAPGEIEGALSLAPGAPGIEFAVPIVPVGPVGGTSAAAWTLPTSLVPGPGEGGSTPSLEGTGGIKPVRVETLPTVEAAGPSGVPGGAGVPGGIGVPGVPGVPGVAGVPASPVSMWPGAPGLPGLPGVAAPTAPNGTSHHAAAPGAPVGSGSTGNSGPGFGLLEPGDVTVPGELTANPASAEAALPGPPAAGPGVRTDRVDPVVGQNAPGAIGGPNLSALAPGVIRGVDEPAPSNTRPPLPPGVTVDDMHRIAAVGADMSRQRGSGDDRGISERRAAGLRANGGEAWNAASRLGVARYSATDAVEQAPLPAAKRGGDAPEPGALTARRGSAGGPVAVSVWAPSQLPPGFNVGAGPSSIGALLASSLESDRVPDLQSQIVQAMRVQWNGTGGDARIRLQPAYLGELTISLKVEAGAVVAHLASATPEVRQWLETNEATLRHGLAQHDLKLERLTVAEEEPATASGDDRAPEDRDERHQPRRRRPPADATFEVVV